MIRRRMVGSFVAQNKGCAEAMAYWSFFCARPDRGGEKSGSSVVGWYNNSKVDRCYQYSENLEKHGIKHGIRHGYNIVANANDAVLLPIF